MIWYNCYLKLLFQLTRVCPRINVEQFFVLFLK